MANTRIYIVTSSTSSEQTHTPRLVRTTSSARALRHVAQDFSVDVASQDDLVRLVGAGIKVENYGAASDAEQPTTTKE